MTRAAQLTPPDAHHGEGPVWIMPPTHAATPDWAGGLYWVDMLAGDLLRLDEAGTVERRHVASVLAMVRPRIGGGFVYAIEHGFAVDSGAGRPMEILPPVEDRPSVRMNEGGCDPAGNLYCGSMAYDATPGAGVFYRLDTSGGVEVVEPSVTIPNGLEWTPDGTRAFHSDTVAERIDVLDWDAAQGLHNRRPFVTVEGVGRPDGLTVDSEGGVWTAVWGAGAVHRYDPNGVLSEVITVPVAQASACTFGGPELDQLFITTSREGLADPEPAAGAVFAVAAGVRGQPVRPFGG
jgi:sugar lactone lactonase YvrE